VTRFVIDLPSFGNLSCLKLLVFYNLWLPDCSFVPQWLVQSF